MKARELLETDVKVGTLVEIIGDECMIIHGDNIYKGCVVNHKTIIILKGVCKGEIVTSYLNQEAKIIKKVVLG